jgi:uncharacterized protein (TIGR02466 family)
MIRDDLFSTSVYRKTCSIDLESLEKKCLDYSAGIKSEHRSNVGGYQGHGFYDEELFLEISQSLPIREDKIIENITAYAWVNINKCGDYNERHHHDPHDGTFMSGVFYVKVPENSGEIKLYDPRPSILLTTRDMTYYNNGYTHYCYKPEENFMLIFPPWLEHSVYPNKSKEKRISIGFNVFTEDV